MHLQNLWMFFLTPFLCLLLAMLHLKHTSKFSVVSLSKFASINFGTSNAGILSKPVKKKRTPLKVNTCPKWSSISPLSTCVKDIWKLHNALSITRFSFEPSSTSRLNTKNVKILRMSIYTVDAKNKSFIRYNLMDLKLLERCWVTDF